MCVSAGAFDKNPVNITMIARVAIVVVIATSKRCGDAQNGCLSVMGRLRKYRRTGNENKNPKYGIPNL